MICLEKFSHTMRARTRLGEMLYSPKRLTGLISSSAYHKPPRPNYDNFSSCFSENKYDLSRGIGQAVKPGPSIHSHPFILFVGTVEPRKNLVNLLEAFADLSPRALERYKLVIAGNPGWGGVDIKKVISSKVWRAW